MALCLQMDAVEAYLYSKAILCTEEPEEVSLLGLAASMGREIEGTSNVIAPGWYHQYDEKEQAVYWFEPVSGATSWTLPLACV